MTQEQKDLLIKDLCARLPYGVKAYVKNWSKLDQKYYEGVYTVNSVHPSINDIYASTENCGVEVILGYDDYFIKPFLFTISSMTDEQKQYLKNRFCYDWNDEPYDLWICQIEIGDVDELIDWFHKNYIDYRCLIPMGLAIDATGLNIY